MDCVYTNPVQPDSQAPSWQSHMIDSSHVYFHEKGELGDQTAFVWELSVWQFMKGAHRCIHKTTDRKGITVVSNEQYGKS